VTVRNCELTDNTDGVRILDSEDVTVFNNLLFENRNRGVFVGASGAGAASSRARLINNTFVLNGVAGIFIGGNEPTLARGVGNNIVQNNEGRNIDVNDGPPSSGEGLSLDYNLVFRSGELPECSRESPQSACGYGPFAPRGPNDINADALFTEPNRQEFFLDQEASPAVDTADPDLDAGSRSARAHDERARHRGWIRSTRLSRRSRRAEITDAVAPSVRCPIAALLAAALQMFPATISRC
jgi:parallel beta-helix repeat protein